MKLTGDNCPRCGSPVVEDRYLGGEVDRYCLASSHPYLTIREIRERDQFLARVEADEARGRRPARPATERTLSGVYLQEAS